MNVPSGMAMLPLTEDDLLDFLFNYFKAEYAPLKSFFFTSVVATPRMPQRWINMGHELKPRAIRPASAQAQNDLAALNSIMTSKNLDAQFVLGIIVRFSAYEQHDRLDRKLYENNRIDLLIRKALKERHLITAVWGNDMQSSSKRVDSARQVDRWWIEMAQKYFLQLRDVEAHTLNRAMEARIQRHGGELILIPYVDHISSGAIKAITPRSAPTFQPARRGPSGRSRNTHQATRAGVDPEAEKIDIQIETPYEGGPSQSHSIRRTTACKNCGSTRELAITVVNHLVSPPPPPYAEGSAHIPQGRQSTEAQRHQRDHTGSSNPARHSAPVPRRESKQAQPTSQAQSTPSTQGPAAARHQRSVSEMIPSSTTETESSAPPLPDRPVSTSHWSPIASIPALPNLNLLRIWPASPTTTTTTTTATATTTAEPIHASNTASSHQQSQPPSSSSHPEMQMNPAATPANTSASLIPANPPDRTSLTSLYQLGTVRTQAEDEDEAGAAWRQKDDDDNEDNGKERKREENYTHGPGSSVVAVLTSTGGSSSHHTKSHGRNHGGNVRSGGESGGGGSDGDDPATHSHGQNQSQNEWATEHANVPATASRGSGVIDLSNMQDDGSRVWDS